MPTRERTSDKPGARGTPPASLAASLRHANDLHRGGLLRDAEQAYLEVLRKYPEDFDALHMLGVLAAQTKRWEESVAWFDRAVAMRRDVATVYNNRANALRNMGRSEESLSDYEHAISLDPDYVDAYRNRGNLLRIMGRLDEALASHARAIECGPRDPANHHAMGNAYARMGRDAEALRCFERAIALRDDFADAHNNLGVARKNLGQLEQALVSYTRAIELKPDFAEAYCNRGNLLGMMKRHAEALADYDRALSVREENAEAHNNRATQCNELKQFDEALASSERAIALNPDNLEAHNNRAVALAGLGRKSGALSGFERIIERMPGHALAYSNRGNLLCEMGRHEEALESYARAIAIDPEFADAHGNLAKALCDLGRYEAAMDSCDTAIALRQDFPEAYINRAMILRETGQEGLALANLEQALSLEPGHPKARLNRALALLRLGRFEEGWPEYEWRWSGEGIPPPSAQYCQPLWLGKESLAGKRILLHSEQGLGDTLQFCRYAAPVAALGAHVILSVESPLVGLLGCLEGVAEIAEKGSRLPEHDYQCPLMSLPLALGTRLSSIPSAEKYLGTDEERVARWARHLGVAKGATIGVVWSGNPEYRSDWKRSIALSHFARALPEHEDIRYVCLQKTLREEDRDALRARPDILFVGDGIADFSDTAALCELMDLVVTVDTSVAHLAGALGRPTWILLPFSADWRWLSAREDSPWYCSVRLFRQPAVGTWESVLARVGRELAARQGLPERETTPSDAPSAAPSSGRALPQAGSGDRPAVASGQSSPTGDRRMPHPIRPIAFVLAASNHGSMIVNRHDQRILKDGNGYGVGFQILNRSSFDESEVGLALMLLDLRRRYHGDGVVALDGGANIGVHTLEWARHMHGWGRVLAFEAQEIVYYALAGNIALNNVLNARARLAALGETRGEARVPRPDYYKPSSFGSLELRQRAGTEFIGQAISYDAADCDSVAMTSIDALDLPRIDLIKLDVEGFEADVLRGARHTLETRKPIMIVEIIKSDRAGIEAALDAHGYKVIPMGINILAIHLDDPVLQHIRPAGVDAATTG